MSVSEKRVFAPESLFVDKTVFHFFLQTFFSLLWNRNEETSQELKCLLEWKVLEAGIEAEIIFITSAEVLDPIQ